MKKTLLDKGRNLMFGMAMGLKRADKEAFREVEHSLNTDDGIEEKVVTNTLMNSLLKGEVTKEVREFRYRLYEICDSAEQKALANSRRNYFVFNEENEEVNFIMENKSVNEDLVKALENAINKHNDEKVYSINFDYKDVTPKYKLTKYVDYVCLKKNGIIELYIPQLLSFDDVIQNSFLKALDKINKKKSYTSLFDFDTLSFITKSVYGIRDCMLYEFSGFKLISIESEKNYYIVRLNGDLIKCENTIAEFYDKEQDEKYKNKEKLNSTMNLTPIQPEGCDDSLINEELKKIYKKDI